MDARTLTRALGGEWHGHYGLCPAPGHSRRDRSLKVWPDQDDPGKVKIYSFASDDWRAVRNQLRAEGLIADDRSPGGPGRSPGQRPRRPVDPEAEERISRLVAAIWRSCLPAEDTLLALYLASRAITEPTPLSIRFHPGLCHRPSGQRLPAMVAAIQGPDRRMVAVHRTWLRSDGTGKADVEPNRMMLGRAATGAVRLAAAGEELALGEGLETCLAVQQATGIPTWAALSTSGLVGVQLPPLPLARTVYIAADHDANGAGERAARTAAERFVAEGRQVKIVVPPAVGQDWNDLLMESAR